MAVIINYKVIGQGTPVIILHGLFGMLDNWLNMAKKLESAGYMIFLIDQRDHGRSSHTDDFSYPLLADDLYRFMEENWIHQAIIIGHSMGGKTALQFASEHPLMVTKMVIIDICTKAYKGGHKDIFDALFAINLKRVQSRQQAEDTLMARLQDYGTVQFLMKNLTRSKEGHFEWKMNLSLLHARYQNILDEIAFSETSDVDIRFIKGGNSHYIEKEDEQKIKSIFPKSDIITIEDAGHWVHVDKPNELFNEIIHFIKH